MTLTIVGLGPHSLDRCRDLDLLLDPANSVIVRTLRHPGAEELAEQRTLVDCDDLYDAAETFDDVYAAIADRVVTAASAGPVVYAVPGSPLVGERSVTLVDEVARARGIALAVRPAESFVESALAALRFDPLWSGLQVLDGADLTHPLLLHVPTLIGHLTTAHTVYAVRDALLTLLDGDTEVTLLSELGGPDERVELIPLHALGEEHAGLRVSLFVDVPTPGWPGLVQTNARLRQECPWDREQTHHSLATHLVEEAHETVSALQALPSTAPEGELDVAAYLEVEEELGDLLLQVVFHSTLAEEAGVFDVEQVAEGIRRKLVRRHPHVFGDVDAPTAADVEQNWEKIKAEEKSRDSLMDDVPASLPALAYAAKLQRRAASAGFDWENAADVLPKIAEEADEIAEASQEMVGDEVGDLLFAVVNLARHLGVDAEAALRGSADRFARRFRQMESAGPLDGLTLAELDARWEAAKAAERRGASPRE